MRYFIERCGHIQPDGTLVISPEYYRVLRRQIDTPYAELSEAEQDSDREEADKVLALIGIYDGE
jgi:hypothetical protein